MHSSANMHPAITEAPFAASFEICEKKTEECF